MSFSDDYDGLAETLLIHAAGLNLSDPQQKNTATRFVKALRELTTAEDFEFTTFEVDVDQMVIVKDIHFATLCKHHVLPFIGVCHIGYVSDGKIAGLSKIPRLVAQCSAGLSTQEELTDMIAVALSIHLNPQGVAVVMEAQHTCMSIRGARSNGSTTRTMAVTGVFKVPGGNSMNLNDIVTECANDSDNFWPEKTYDIPYIVLALSGESGELAEEVLALAIAKSTGKVADMVKKVERGDIMYTELKTRIAEEAVDCLIYLACLFHALEVDAEAMYTEKRDRNVERFGISGTASSGGPVVHQ